MKTAPNRVGNPKPPSAARSAAARANLAKARAVQVSRGYCMTEARLAANRANLQKARRRRALHWRHGLACASVWASLAGAGERACDFLRHMVEISEAFAPRDAWEEKVVAGIGEALWRRFRGLRLAARWHTRQLVGLLSGMARRGRSEMLPDAHESPAQNARRRSLRARRIAMALLVRLAGIQKAFAALKRVNRRLLLLTAALMRERLGEPLVDAPYAGAARAAAVADLPPEKIGNAFARRARKKTDKTARLPRLPDEDEPGPAGDGRPPHLIQWEALLVAAFGPGAGQAGLEGAACVLWAHVEQLAEEARAEARQLRAALRKTRRLAEEDRLPALAVALEDAAKADEGMDAAADYLGNQLEAFLDQALVARYGPHGGLRWMERVVDRYDRWVEGKEDAGILRCAQDDSTGGMTGFPRHAEKPPCLSF